MQILFDALLAMLAAVGIWSIAGLFLDLFFSDIPLMILVCAHDDGADLKYIVRRHISCFHNADICLVDCGLNETGIVMAQRLMEENHGIRMCSRNHVELLMKEAEKWTTQDNAMK